MKMMLGIVLMLVAVMGFGVFADEPTPPNPPRGLEGKQSTPSNPPAEARGNKSVGHLRVEVETKYAWIYQKSVARVWATASAEDTTRVPVGELCLQLDCYGSHKICETDTSYLELTEIKRRLGVSKRTAYVKAWSNDPAIDTVRVEMKP